MHKTFTLSIPKPCSEQWSNFTPNSQGGFCSSCSKTVVDFTKMTDDEVISFFQGRSQHVCGRFAPQQLRGYTPIAFGAKPGFPLLKAAVVSALLVLAGKSSYAQAQAPTERVKTTKESRKDKQEKQSIPEEQVVRGVVLDPMDKSPIPGVNIVHKGTTNGTVTNFEGRFEFPAKLQEGDVLVFSFIGYETKEYVVPKSKDFNVELALSLCLDVSIMGEVAVNEVYHEEPSSKGLWSRIKSIF